MLIVLIHWNPNIGDVSARVLIVIRVFFFFVYREPCEHRGWSARLFPPKKTWQESELEVAKFSNRLPCMIYLHDAC